MTALELKQPALIMPKWFRLDLGDPMLADAELDQLCERARRCWKKAGNPGGWAVYSRLESGDLHCRLWLYFTPAAGEFARQCKARPCRAPGGTDLQRRVGTD